MNIVLFEPEIHWNTGNIGRTCVATGTTLHLVGKLGFEIDDKAIKRSGMDYWPRLDLKIHESFESFVQTLPRDAGLKFFSTKAATSYWQASYASGDYLILGKEGGGLPKTLHEEHAGAFFRIPIKDEFRSLNLSTAAGVILFEALRQTGYQETLKDV